MKKTFFSLVMVAMLALSACAPAVTASLPSPTEAATNTPSTPEPTVSSVSASPEPSSQDELTFKVVKQMGGTFDAVAVDGSIVYLGIGARFATVDISDPASPRLLWQSEVLADRPAAIAVRSGMAYVRVGNEMLVYDVSQPPQPALVSTLSEVSGDLVTAGDFVYALFPGDDSQQLIAIDVSDPAQPAIMAKHELSGTAALAVSGEVLYLVSGGGASNDATAPGTFQLIHRTQVLSQITLEEAWNYQVAVEGDFAFVVENNQNPYNPDMLLVLDVSDPANPREFARREMSVGQEIKVTNGALFLLGRAFPHEGCPAGLRIVDVTDPASPQDPTNFDPQSCFNRFAVDGDTLTATSELGLEIYNISDPANIALTGELAPPDGFITADQIVLNQNLAYLVTTAGRNRLLRLRVLDIAGPTPKLLTGGFDLAAPEPGGYGEPAVRGDRLYGLEQGVVEVDISDPANPRLITKDRERFFYNPTPARVGNVLYTRLWDEQSIAVVDMSDPANQVVVNTLPLDGFAPVGVSATDRHLFVFSQKEFTRLQVFDVSDPLMPVEVGLLEPAVDPSEQVEGFAVSGDTVYAASRRGVKSEGFKFTIYALDISDPSHPREISRFELPDDDFVTKLVPVGDTIYMRLYNNGIRALNVSDRFHPYLSGHFPFPINDFAVHGDLLYLAAGDAGLLIVQVKT